MIAQSTPDWQRWLDQAPPVPDFPIPQTRPAWETRRQETRARLWQLLGHLPPRPAEPKVQTISRTDHGEYILEKFRFDNGAGADVPGYLFLPKQTSGKAPAILYCHWHGGEYDSGKEELLHADHTPVKPVQPWPGVGMSFWGSMPIASESAMAEDQADRPKRAAPAN